MSNFVLYLYISCSGSITSTAEEKANLSAIIYLKLCYFCSERFANPLTWQSKAKNVAYFNVLLAFLSTLFYLL